MKYYTLSNPYNTHVYRSYCVDNTRAFEYYKDGGWVWLADDCADVFLPDDEITEEEAFLEIL